MVLKDFIAFIIVFFEVHLRNLQKEWMKPDQLDYCKVKILENQGEFDILIKDSV